MAKNEICYWLGRPITDLTRDELIEAFGDMVDDYNRAISERCPNPLEHGETEECESCDGTGKQKAKA